MIWEFINTGFNCGEYNMQYDVHLANKKEQEVAILRLYRWTPYCISLGANQQAESINISKAKKNLIDVVNRPTGGRAILHAEELTYSIIYPASHNLSPRQLYHEINSALKAGLINYNPVFQEIELENLQPDFTGFYNQKVSELCFAVSAKSELKFNGKKLVGSAQRKMDKTILQHGSILCGEYHTKIVDYLNYSASQIEKMRDEINATTIDMKSILGEDINYDRLIDSIRFGIQKQFKMNFKSLSEEIDSIVLMN